MRQFDIKYYLNCLGILSTCNMGEEYYTGAHFKPAAFYLTIFKTQ